MSEFLSPSERRPALPAGSPHPWAPGPAGLAPEVEETPLHKYLGALRRRYWLVALLGCVGLGIAYYVISNTEALYTSKAVLQLSEERGAPSMGGGLAGLAMSLGGGGSSIESQIQIMRSRVLLGQVVDSLGLRVQRVVPGLVRDNMEPTGIIDDVYVPADAAPDSIGLEFGEAEVRARMAGAEAAAPYGAPLELDGIRFTVPVRPDREHLTLWVISRDDAVDVLLDAVRPSTREGTNVVDVWVNGYDSIITKKIANTTAEYYRQFSSRKSREQAQARKQFVMNQLAVAESLLAETQAQLTEYRKRERIYSAKAEAALETTGRGALELRRAEMEAERKAFRSTLAELRQADDRGRLHLLRALAAAPGIAENAVVGNLYAQLSHYDAQRDSILAGPPRRSPTHPEVLAVDSMRKAAEARLIAAVGSYADMLDARLAAVNDIKARTDRALAHIAESEPEEVRLMLRMESIGDAARELRARYYTAGMAEAAEIDQVTMLDYALAGDRAGSGPGRTLLFGLLFGLVVGGAGAILVDSSSRTLRRKGELEHFLRVPGLAAIPQLGQGSRWSPLRLPIPARNGNGDGKGRTLVAAGRTDALVAEAYRTLRTNLIFSQDAQGLRSLVVTSPSPAEGKTTTVANLGVAFAQQGLRVLLVDCDLRRPGLHALFGLPREPGLAQLLLGEAAVEQVVRKTAVDRLSVLPAGRLPSAVAADVLGGGVMASLLDALSAEFDLVILDTPPVLVTASAAILATQVDGVLVVVRAGQTDRDSAREAVRQITAVGGRVFGSVLNGAEIPGSRHEAYFGEETVGA